MVPDMDNKQPLIDFIDDRRRRLGLSIRELARRAEVSHGALSNLLRGITNPETATIEKLADALGADRVHLLQLLAGGHPSSVPEPQIDPEAAYIAQRITELPPIIRKRAVDALGAQLDAIYDVAGIERERRKTASTPEEEYESLRAELEEILLKLRDLRPDMVSETIDGLLGSISPVLDDDPDSNSAGQLRAS